MSIRYIIGIDGGGTGTRAKLTSSAGEVLGAGEAGPSGLRQGIGQAWSNIGLAVQRAFEGAGLPVADHGECAIGIGVAGAHVEELVAEVLAAAPPYAKVAVDHDGYTTLLGAHAGRPGVVVAAGTGSVGEALTVDGRRLAAGGWGFPVGDEGSGAWLGLAAVGEAQRACDGRAPAGPLARAVWQEIGDTRDAILAWCERAGQNAYAQLAPLVFATAEHDRWAATRVEDAAAALEALATALDPAAELPLVVCGTIGLKLAPRFSPSIRARLVPAAGDSADGALRLIRQAL